MNIIFYIFDIKNDLQRHVWAQNDRQDLGYPLSTNKAPKNELLRPEAAKYKEMENFLYFIVQIDKYRHIWSQNDRQDQG